MTVVAAWVGALALGGLVAGLGYGWTAWRGASRLPAVLRVVAVTLLALAALDAPLGPAVLPAPIVAVDASASMTAPDPARWTAALDSAAALPGRDRVRFGDSVELDAPTDQPVAATSRVAPVVRRAVAEGRPLIVVTDGELDDAESLDEAPLGSRVVVVPGSARPDLAVVDLEVPDVVTPGDTVRIGVRVATRQASAGGSLQLVIDGRAVAERPLPTLSADGATRIEVAVPVPEGAPTARFVARVVGGGADAIPSNDSVVRVITRDRVPRIAVASTAPDGDVRDLVATLRETAGTPVRAWYRVAPGRWVGDDGFAVVDESTVRAAVRAASLVVLHGDTTWAGSPSDFAARAVLLVVPPPADAGRDAYLRPPPPSPLRPVLGALAVESLPPLLVAGGVPGGSSALLAAPTPDTRIATPILRLDEGRPRRAVLAAAGWSRWRRRGGVAALGFQSLIGAPIDWLAAAPPRGARPTVAPGVLRAGVPVRITRGDADSATLDLARDGDGTRARAVLDFARGAGTADAPPLAEGTWRGRLGGAPVVLAVNAVRELLPRAPTVRAGAIAGAAEPQRRGARALGWLYLAAAVTLAGEWLARRRVGLR